MMDEILHSLFRSIKIVVDYAWLMALSLGFVLFGSNEWVTKLGLDKFREEHHVQVGLGLLLSSIFVLGQIIRWMWLKKLSHRRRQRKLKRVESRLDRLSNIETMWIVYCLYYNQSNLTARPEDQAANALCHKGILVRHGAISGFSCNYTIPDDVWNLLQHKKQVFLDLLNEVDGDQEQKLQEFKNSLLGN